VRFLIVCLKIIDFPNIGRKLKFSVIKRQFDNILRGAHKYTTAQFPMYIVMSIAETGFATKCISLLSVIIPVYNQERKITMLLESVKEALNLTLLNYEIIIVNDGSLDNTSNLLLKEEKRDSHIQVISYPQNKGKGHAVRTGIMKTHGDIVLFVDGDLDITPRVIKDYVNELQNCDLVIASKNHPLSKVNAPGSRKFLSRAFNLFVRITTGIKLKDTQSGLKAGDGNALRTIFNIMVSERYAFDVEMLAIATVLGMRIKELPIEISLDQRFKLRDIAKMFIDVIAISYRFRVKLWYHKQLKQV
jgi:glycosyltransferase involved in cell wall biosynthesis